jgi:hypothetical protein
VVCSFVVGAIVSNRNDFEDSFGCVGDFSQARQIAFGEDTLGGLMSWLGDGVASPPTRMRGTPIVLTDDSAHDTQRSSTWRTVINMKMKSRGEPTSPIVATIASSFISSAVTWCAR